MILDLDKYEVESVVLNQKVCSTPGTFKKGCVDYCVENGLVKTISIRLSEFYSEGETFEGDLRINGNRLNLDASIQPKSINAELNEHVEHWDDGVEVNYQYRRNSVGIEFSWHWVGDKLIANYVCLEAR